MKNFYDLMEKEFEVNREVLELVDSVESKLNDRFEERKEIALYNQLKILKAMQKNKLTATDFNWTTGYGYGDIGREKVESIYADVFKTEDALVRPNIVSGTHAISLALFSILKNKDHLLYISGKPYDTLLKVIGYSGNEALSMKEMGIDFSYCELKENKICRENIEKAIRKNTKVVAIQRSTGYSDRRALTIEEIEEGIKIVKELLPDAIIFVDNCYGEFTEFKEPSEVGADIMAGSLIKNPGGGLAYSGGYIVGKSEFINRCANRLTAPGIGKECGLTFGMTRQILQGLFLAPKVVEDAIKGSILLAAIFEKFSYRCIPTSSDKRSDIIEAIELKTKEKVEEFCKAIQETSPVDSQFTPMPWDMPGYEEQVIMAAGDFIEGSSIELSADGPMREPYFVYFQGGLTYEHIKIAIINVVNKLKEKKLL